MQSTRFRSAAEQAGGLPCGPEVHVAAVKNTLVVGRGRLGWMVDGNPDTPETAVLLEDDGSDITLTVPWPAGSRNSAYERWFVGGSVRYGDDPDKIRFAYRVPEILWFHDPHGSVALVRCQASGSNSDLFSGPGQGVASVSFAVFGARRDFRTINGLRTEIPGLGDWIGLRSITRSTKTDDKNRYSSVEIKAESPDPLYLDRRLNLTIRPNWSTSTDEPDSTTVRETLRVESLVMRPRTWEEHLEAHQSVRDLLDIATWRPSEYAALHALRSDDPERTMSGAEVGPRWAAVLTRRLRRPKSSTSRVDHLFTFDDIGTTGFRRWVRLRDRFERGINPMLGLLDFEGAQVQTTVAQSGLAFEAIGLELAVEDGVAREKAGREPHRTRLGRLAESLPQGLFSGVVDDLGDWATRSTESYNAVKHANRTMPDLLTLLNTERENELIFRAWVANRIGVPASRLRHALERDRFASPYELA